MKAGSRLNDLADTITIGKAYGEQSLNNEPIDDVEQLYLQHRSLLYYVAVKKFNVPEDEAESLIHEIFIALVRMNRPVENIRAWLVGAMCNACRHYWREKGKLESYKEHSDQKAVSIAEAIAAALRLRDKTPR